MTDTESTESVKDDVQDDDSNFVPSSQDDDYEPKLNKKTRSQTQQTDKGKCYRLGIGIRDEIVIIRKVFPPLKDGVVNLWKDGPMAPFEKIPEIIPPNPINKVSYESFTEQLHQPHTNIDLLRFVIHENIQLMFAKGYTLQQDDDMYYHEVLHTCINNVYNRDNIVTEDDSQEKKASTKKTKPRRSVNDVLEYRNPLIKVNKMNLGKQDDGDEKTSDGEPDEQNTAKEKKKMRKLGRIGRKSYKEELQLRT